MLENNISKGVLVVPHSFKNIIGSIGLTPFYTNKDTSCILYNADCLNVMDSIPPNSIDMIFADPPYFLSNGGMSCHAGKRVSVDKGDWDKSKGIEETHKFNLEWLKRCQNILTKDGTIWVSGTSHVIFSIGFAMQQLGLKILNDIAWYKVNPPPNLCCRYFTHATETVLWAAKNKESKHYFNYPLMKKMNNNKQMQSLWSITAPKMEEKIYGKHPTQKPVTLLERIVLASTKEHDTILDPFAGSSTTGVASYRLGRRFIGIDSNKEYLELSIKRLNFEQRTKQDVRLEIQHIEKDMEKQLASVAS
ncbi:MAG: site-specific DNA-methyltransferase [Candidatus Omnitrophica bacterium]|nr:site-specific DNA-methyltransferase [Candidatus Omnitrophota bacterium]